MQAFEFEFELEPGETDYFSDSEIEIVLWPRRARWIDLVVFTSCMFFFLICIFFSINKILFNLNKTCFLKCS